MTSESPKARAAAGGGRRPPCGGRRGEQAGGDRHFFAHSREALHIVVAKPRVGAEIAAAAGSLPALLLGHDQPVGQKRLDIPRAADLHGQAGCPVERERLCQALVRRQVKRIGQVQQLDIH